MIRNGYFWTDDANDDWVEWPKKLLCAAVKSAAIVPAGLEGR